MPSQVNAMPLGIPNLWHMLVGWRERRFVRACCVELLGLYQRAERLHPGLSAEALYRQVVAAKLSREGREVDDVIQGARVSYANWPVERDLCFRDVVHYLAVSGYCEARGRKPWLRSHVVDVIDAEIPAEL
jgi:hypothetical protein